MHPKGLIKVLMMQSHKDYRNRKGSIARNERYVLHNRKRYLARDVGYLFGPKSVTQIAQTFEEEKWQILTQAAQNFEEETRQISKDNTRQIVSLMIKKDYPTEEIISLVPNYSWNDVEALRIELSKNDKTLFNE